MKKIMALFICSVAFLSAANAQYTRYIVRLKDKGTNPFSIANPSQYLSQRALQRRTKYNISIDSTDLPVTPRYVDSIRLAGAVTVLNTSKWLNQVAIKTSDAAALAKINSLPFVIGTTAVAAKNSTGEIPANKQLDGPAITGGNEPVNSFTEGTAGVYNYGVSHGQVAIHNGDFLHDHGFRGEGMQMVMLDAGYYHYQTLRTFDSVRNNNQILGTWDFVTNDAEVNEDDVHGMECFSTISANIPGLFVGTAPKASFYLFRTEDNGSEYQIEEQNYAAGIERADSLGVDICSASLGYNQFQNPANSYTYADMNGNTTITARAADYAAKKGIMMVVAAGNEGNTAWHYLITPSDADSVMAVGAVDTTGVTGTFSSYGPSSDGRVKPNVASVGSRAVVANPGDGNPIFGNGTSFATPNIAGLTTCLMQAFPEYSNMVIMDAMQRSGTRATNPDNRVGYGIPDMKKAFVILQRKSYAQQAAFTDCNNTVKLKVKFDQSMTVIVEKKTGAQGTYSTFQTIAGTGNFSLKDLSFTDNVINAGAAEISYRIKMQVAADTSFYFDSLTVAVPVSCASPDNSVKLMTNPVTSDLNIVINRTAATKINIMVTNTAGQRIYTTTYQQSAGPRLQSINMAANAGGLYFVTVFADGKKIWTEQVMKK